MIRYHREIAFLADIVLKIGIKLGTEDYSNILNQPIFVFDP